MYGWLWRALPGPLWLRVTTAVVLALLLVAVLFTAVFPAVAGILPTNDGTVG